MSLHYHFDSYRHGRNFDKTLMDCRVGCGACCIAPSISSPIPGMPDGKPAGVRCVQLTDDNRCKLYGHPDRPAVCERLRPSPEMCGENIDHAFAYLRELEYLTQPFSTHHVEAGRRDHQSAE